MKKVTLTLSDKQAEKLNGKFVLYLNKSEQGDISLLDVASESEIEGDEEPKKSEEKDRGISFDFEGADIVEDFKKFRDSQEEEVEE